MKNLENVAGLQEMSLQEMRDVNGGFWVGLIVGLLVAECLDPDNQKDFDEGRQAARDFW